MATGQYLTEVAVRLVERGHQVTVVTSRRAYDHPEKRVPETGDLAWHPHLVASAPRVSAKAPNGGGRRTLPVLSSACCWRLALLPRHDAVVALTTPPLISFIGAWLARLLASLFLLLGHGFQSGRSHRRRLASAGSLAARLLERMSRFSLRRAKKVIALDRFMRDRIVAKGIPPAKVAVIPPWSHDTEVRFDPAGRERFRQAHGLDGKFVVMYSGNHSPVHPLDTLLAAAERMRSDQGWSSVSSAAAASGARLRRARGPRDH